MRTQIDGLTQTVTAQFAPFDDTFVTWWWVGAALSMAAQLVYVMFVLGKRRLTVRALVYHLASHPDASAAVWPVPWTLTLGGMVLLPLAIAAVVTAWVGGEYVQGNVDTPVLTAFDFDFFTATITAYVAAQVAAAPLRGPLGPRHLMS